MDKSFIMDKFRFLKLLGFPQEIVLREETCTKDAKEKWLNNLWKLTMHKKFWNE